MDDSLPAWVSLVGGVITVGVALYGAWKARFEVENLRGRNIKESLELIAEVERRIEQDSAGAWRYPDAKRPKGSFEDSLARDLLASQIFGRRITWADWLEIRKFLTEHDNIPLHLLRTAWFCRDQTKAPQVHFRMTWRVWQAVLAFWFLTVGGCVMCVIGFAAVFLSLIWLFLVHFPAITKWLISVGALAAPRTAPAILFNGREVLPYGILIFVMALVVMFVSLNLYSDGEAARLICKRMKKRASENEKAPE